MRRCGKSTLWQQLVEHYQLESRHCAFINFEDPRLASALSFETLDDLVSQFRSRNPGAAQLTFFLDEIQWVQGWQRWLVSQLERPRGNLFVITGSNSQLLSGEFSSLLTGRHLTIEPGPFDYDELRVAAPGGTRSTTPSTPDSGGW